MGIPIKMLWRVQMSLRKKCALAGIFLLATITCVFAIVRVTVISTLTRQPDTSWSYMWSSIEQCIGKRPLLQLQSRQRYQATHSPFAYSHNRCLPCIFQEFIRTTSVSLERAASQYYKRLQECTPSRDSKAAPHQRHIHWAYWSLYLRVD